ncbi:response regulator [bacterium]|nr:response regulator [bacterium]
MRILIVEDEPDSLYLLEVLLQNHGHKVMLARDGIEALEKARAKQPDLVVSDILMPRMDGFTLCQEWRKDEALRDIPFIVYTATYTDAKDERLALGIGADRFIRKPAEPQDFIEEIDDVVRQTGRRRPAAEGFSLGEEEALKLYNTRLVKKLEEKSLDLELKICGLQLAEDNLQSANRALGLLNACNMEMMRASDEGVLLDTMCRIIVELGGYRSAWVGLAESGERKSIRIVSSVGLDAAKLGTSDLIWGDAKEGSGPVARAIRTGQPVVDRVDRGLGRPPAWQRAAGGIKSRSLAALPITTDARACGALVACSSRREAFGVEEIGLLAELAGNLAYGMRTLRAEEGLRKSCERLNGTLQGTVRALASTVEMRDPYTAGHQLRVAELAVALAEAMGLPDDEREAIRTAALVHDVGKIAVPAEILTKPGRLTELEFEMVKGHAQAGYDAMRDIGFQGPVAQIVLQHHERMNGSGYPQGLNGEDILAGARVLAVADTVEAMSSHRPHRAALGVERALEEVSEGRGTEYDSDVVEACLRVFREKGFEFTDA